jgi:predicted kinase
MLIITHGLSGSGKTTWTNALLEQLPDSVRVRSDIERKRLYGLKALEQSKQRNIGAGIYNPDANRATYQRLHDLACELLRNGFTAIVEATFLWHNGRRVFKDLANDLGIPFFILDVQARKTTLTERITRRQKITLDASEADLSVLCRQIDNQDHLMPDEHSSVITIDTETYPDIEAIAKLMMTRALPPTVDDYLTKP